MSLPVIRAKVYFDITGEIELIVNIDGAMIRGELRRDDALRLMADLMSLTSPRTPDAPSRPTVAEVTP